MRARLPVTADRRGYPGEPDKRVLEAMIGVSIDRRGADCGLANAKSSASGPIRSFQKISFRILDSIARDAEPQRDGFARASGKEQVDDLTFAVGQRERTPRYPLGSPARLSG
jgi:hypothetical protein